MTDVSTTCADPSSESSHLTLKMGSALVLKTSVTSNSPSQDSNHPDDLFQSRQITLLLHFYLLCNLFRLGEVG